MIRVILKPKKYFENSFVECRPQVSVSFELLNKDFYSVIFERIKHLNLSKNLFSVQTHKEVPKF